MQYLGNYWADYAETSHACGHPPGNASLCVTVGVRLHVRTCKATMFQISRTAGPIALKVGILMGSVSRGAYKSKLGPTLHVRTCRVTALDLKNGWTDWAQLWYTVRDRLVGCRAQVNWRYPGAISHVQGSLSRSLRWSPQKALYWLLPCYAITRHL